MSEVEIDEDELFDGAVGDEPEVPVSTEEPVEPKEPVAEPEEPAGLTAEKPPIPPKPEWRLKEDAERARAAEAELAFRAGMQKVKQSALQTTFEWGGDRLSPFVRAIESIFVPIHALIHQPFPSASLSQAEAAARREADEAAAKWLSDLAVAIPDRGPIPPFHAPASLPSGEEQPAARLRARWLELLEDRIARLAAERQTAPAAEATS